ncbi:MAG: alpha/beta hydrolase [Myxococcota bacterium]|nr:alpha/beta hydrolase [Myxococcota bacterium]
MLSHTKNALRESRAWVGRKVLNGRFRKGWRQLGGVSMVSDTAEPIPYLLFDRGATKTLVNLHGFGDCKETFLLVIARLGKEYNIVVPDLPGFGATKPLQDLTYTIDNYTVWMSDFLRWLGMGPYWISGNSLGGAIASNLSFLHPDLVRLCMPISSAGYINDGFNPLYEEFFSGGNPFFIEDKDGYLAFTKRLFHTEMKPIPLISSTLRTEMIRKRFWYQKLADDMQTYVPEDVPDRFDPQHYMNAKLRDTSVRFHFIWGEYDALFPSETVQLLHRTNPNVKSDIIRECGHCPHLERPRKLAEVLRRILHTERI